MCAAQSVRESTVKAAWFSHFSKFIEWPNIGDTTNTFVIKVLGEDEFESNLDKIYTTRLIKNKPVTIEYIDDILQIGHCHILYISSNRRKFIDEILNEVASQPILTVSGVEGLGQKGVLINFFNEQNKIRFEFNLIAAKNNELEVSFRLLELAKIIK
jgi:hypothetical protein